MAFFMFQFMYLQILLLAYAVADGVYWNVSTTPAIFGQDIMLTCNLEEISINPTECSERKWIVDPGNKVLTNKEVSSDNKKYKEVISHNPTFAIMIMNLTESDVNVDYTCTCDYESFSKKLVLNEERFHYPPIGTTTNFSVHNGLLKVTVHMPKVYPVPNCSLMVGDIFIQSKAVRYSKNGIVYTVDFNAEYKFREKDCNKKPIVVCTFGMVSGPVRFEGDETYKCLIIKCTAPVISKFTITSTNTDVVPSTEVKYTCEFGYQLPAGDLGTRICQLGGTWSAPPPACEVIKCTAPEINEFTITSTNTDVVPSTEVTYTCESGYHLQVPDSRTRICQLGGTWSAPPPACVGLFGFICSIVKRLFSYCVAGDSEKQVSTQERRWKNEQIVTLDNVEFLARKMACGFFIIILFIMIGILLLVVYVMSRIRKRIWNIIRRMRTDKSIKRKQRSN